jgi:hypothetical protein
MATSARELLGWSEARWTAVQEAVDKALAQTAKCRQVIPMGPEMIGEKAVIVPTIGNAAPLAYNADTIATPVHIYVDVTLDDLHAENEADCLRLIAAGAAQLGMMEDQEIVQSAPAGGKTTSAPPRAARVVRNASLRRANLSTLSSVPTSAIKAAGPTPTSTELAAVIGKAVSALENVGRPGPTGLLLHTQLLAILSQPVVAGGGPMLQPVEQLIGSSEVVGTSALDGNGTAGAVCGILFRLEPPAVDLAYAAPKCLRSGEKWRADRAAR